MSKILLTGSSGFIGQALAQRLLVEGHRLKLPVRSKLSWESDNAQVFHFDGLEASTDWSAALKGVDAVIHCAAPPPGMNETAADPLAEYRRCNVNATVRLASQAARAGVRRFVFVSTVEVCGEETPPDQPFSVDSVPAPASVSFHAISKLEAERALFALTASSGMEAVIIRPPLVYGPGVKGDFHALMRLLDSGKPLPLADAKNRRSMISRSNLIDALTLCLRHPAVAGHILHVSDGEDLSVAALLSKLGEALGKPPKLSGKPAWPLMKRVPSEHRALIKRLKTHMQVDMEHTRHLLNWNPPYGVDDSLEQTVAHFLKYPQN